MNRESCKGWIPDWSDLDEAWAWQTLNGLQQDEAIQMLNSNPLTLTEAIYYSKGECFLFYFGVLFDYLLSEASQSNFAAADAFWGLLTERLVPADVAIGSAGVTLLDGARLIASRQGFYDADFDIYGDFWEEYQRFVTAVAARPQA